MRTDIELQNVVRERLRLEGELLVLLLEPRQRVPQRLHVAQQDGRHHHAALLVAGVSAVVLELARRPDALRAAGILLRATDEAQQVAGVLLEHVDVHERLDVDRQEVVAQRHGRGLASGLVHAADGRAERP